MAGRMNVKPTTRRDAADAVRLKHAGDPAHINTREAALLQRLMPEAAGPVVTRGLLAEAGRRGDTAVTKLIPAEQALLKAHGGSGTRNPATGLLEFGDGMGGSDNPGGGHNADNGPSGTGGPSGGGYGGGGYGGPGGGGYYGGDVNTKPDIANMSLAQLQDQFSQRGGWSIESLLSMPNNYRAPGYEDLPGAFQYSPPDTFGRLRDVALHGPPPSYTERGRVPGTYGAPTGLGPGFAKKAMSTLAAGPAAPALSGLMTLGGWMDQAMSPETRAASLDANQAQGAKNSTGRDPVSGMTMANMASATPGVRSGAETAPMTPPPGYTINPAGQVIPLPGGGNNRSPLRQPLRNAILDYLLSDTRGSGNRWL
jgi:hypothetical protein